MSKQWKCPFCAATRHKTLEAKTTGVWFVRLECTPCGQVFTATKHGTTPEGGPDPLKLINLIGQQEEPQP